MPVAIDTSILVHAEKLGSFETVLPRNENGPFYIPALAAAEFLVGTHTPVRDALRYRALLLYQSNYRHLVEDFTETDARQLATLIADLRRTGQAMKFFDAAIAATAMVRGDALLTADNDYDRLSKKLTLIKI
jgi:predicted nucleic acid-binding protein